MTHAKQARPEFPSAPVDKIADPLRKFIETEAAGGVVILLGATLALFVANSSLGPAFDAFWSTNVGLHIGGAAWDHSLRHWVNDGLVTLFFFVVGLEIKRELACGELSKPGAVVLPFAAALGGMAVPAAIYLLLAPGADAASGWGTVMATDIAFVVGCLALLGKRVPRSLRTFMLSLAIIDDLGAILVIALGYTHNFQFVAFCGALGGLVLVAFMRWLGVRPILLYWLVGLATWAAFHESGIHATVAGVALGLMTPVTPWIDKGKFASFLDWAQGATGRSDQEVGAPSDVSRPLARAAKESVSPQERLESDLHPWSAFFVLPLFALANAGVVLSGQDVLNPVVVAIIAGLTIGKPLGIFGFAWLAVTFGIARKPDDVSWLMLLAGGMLAGIGFTMAIFIGQLAFAGEILDAAKFGVLAASVLSAMAGMSLFLVVSKRRPREA